MLQKSYRNSYWKSLIYPWQQVDLLLMSSIVSLTVFAVVMIRSTELNQGTHWLQHLGVGSMGMLISLTIARWPYKFLLKLHWLIYAIVNLSLILVLIIGTEANGSKSWFNFGSFNIQPSEFAKIGVIVTIAAILHQHPASNLSSIFRVLGVVALPWILILKQDLGTSLVFGAIVLGMLYWSNANPGWLILLISPLVSAILYNLFEPAWLIWTSLMVLIAWITLPWKAFSALATLGINLGTGKLGQLLWNFLQPYQKDRLTLFLTPEKDPLGGGYHLIQSRIAIGSGGIWGKGINQGTQTQLNFIPEQHTDFIFSAVGEQLGFVGCIALLLMFWFICLRLVAIASNAKEDFGSLIAIGVLSTIAFQVILNISMTIGIAPITGIPLPWMSYGGSSLLTNFIAVGLVESVANFRKRKRRFT